MAKTIRIIRNSKKIPCGNCTTAHEYLTRQSSDADCSTPVAYERSKAERIARVQAGGAEDVVPIPDDTVVVMDDSARSLPKRNAPELQHTRNRVRNM